MLIFASSSKTCNWLSKIKVKVQQSRNRPGVAQRVPEDLGSQISCHSAHEGGEVVSLTKPPKKFCWYPFSLGAESIPEPCYGGKEYATEKSSDTTGN
jgi:hypothetical protein